MVSTFRDLLAWMQPQGEALTAKENRRQLTRLGLGHWEQLRCKTFHWQRTKNPAAGQLGHRNNDKIPALTTSGVIGQLPDSTESAKPSCQAQLLKGSWGLLSWDFRVPRKHGLPKARVSKHEDDKNSDAKEGKIRPQDQDQGHEGCEFQRAGQ